jgi:hypothetical protein
MNHQAAKNSTGYSQQEDEHLSSTSLFPVGVDNLEVSHGFPAYPGGI